MKNKFNLIKRVASVMLAAVICAVSLGVTAFADSETFKGAVTADSGIYAGGIEIEVYGSRLKYSKNGLNRYEHYLSRTVTTDSSGSFTFSKPTDKVLLRVKTDTLPAGTGVSNETLFVSGKTDNSLSLSKVKSIGITSLNGGTGVNITPKNAAGDIIYAPVDVQESYSANIGHITYSDINDVQISRRITASSGNVRVSKTLKVDISDCTVSGKLARLLDYGIITQTEKERILAENQSDTAVAEDERPQYIDERTFTAGNFMLHYEYGTPCADEYVDIFADIIDVFFDQYDFDEPYHEFVPGSRTQRDDYFHVYLVSHGAISIDSDVAPRSVSGRTKKIDLNDVTRGGYVVVDPNGDISAYTKTMSHEIFHGIIYRYAGKNVASWFEEAFANYGALLYMGEVNSSMKTQISRYLKSTQYKLSSISDYRSRQYGEMLIPLYIHNKMGGVGTIKKVMKAYSKTSNSLTAISNGLKSASKSYTFDKLLTGAADFTAYTKFYKLPGTSSSINIGINARRTVSYKLSAPGMCSVSDMTLEANGAMYYEFKANDTQKGTLAVTIDTSAGAGNMSYNLITEGKSVRIAPRGATSKLMTFEVTDFGKNGTKTAVLSAVNTSQKTADKAVFAVSAKLG
ncbi:MAG: hypothetical protein II820_00470 [Ruminiclostridium sp.]|nr:hypothetical protein [Ruminiclostridium sp.]